MAEIEQPDKFYLGADYDLAQRARSEQPLLYDSKDLTTHAVCVGMTGSGKTGLCLALLEEAALDGIPAIAIDPKGDLGNLLLAFPELRPSDFRPWIDDDEAARQGITADELAAQTADRWRKGLADWNQQPERIQRFCDAVDRAIYTPGSSAGLPLSVLRSFAAPPQEIMDDGDLLRDRIGAEVSGLLALVGIAADPIKSREHILISKLLETAWREKRDLTLADLVREIQKPPIREVGSLEIDTFYPLKQRTELALKLNNLLASPGFASWMEGEPLDVQKLLYTADGKPRLSIISIAHLDEAERMFIVTLLLNEVLSWIRTQSGTSNLRAILYMDEVFGYFPPTANPPSKRPMLTLLKQARAYGLGVVLATQNPVDLDYKGLSNAGTWFLGRLQTERDKARVLEGLEGASAAAGSVFDRGKMEATLAALGARVFLLNNVHEDKPVVFQTRWCLSYLRGPLSRSQIQTLMADRKAAASSSPASRTRSASEGSSSASSSPASSISPAAAGEVFLVRAETPAPMSGTIWQPQLFGTARLHFVDARAQLDCTRDVAALVALDGAITDRVWAKATVCSPTALKPIERPADAPRAPLMANLDDPKAAERAAKSLVDFLYDTQTLALWYAPDAKEHSRADEPQEEFRARLVAAAERVRDEKLKQLKDRFDDQQAALEKKIKTAEARVNRESGQFWRQVWQTILSALGAITQIKSSRKWTSQRNISTTTSTARSAGRVAREHEESSRVKQQLAELVAEQEEAREKYNSEVAAIQAEAANPRIEPYPVRPRKGDLVVERVALAWLQ